MLVQTTIIRIELSIVISRSSIRNSNYSTNSFRCNGLKGKEPLVVESSRKFCYFLRISFGKLQPKVCAWRRRRVKVASSLHRNQSCVKLFPWLLYPFPPLTVHKGHDKTSVNRGFDGSIKSVHAAPGEGWDCSPRMLVERAFCISIDFQK